ncbi:MAG: conjugal transfer protein, partial [Neisseria sp.]|nr:conjugal transfer protein [Neisseria sp.]
QAAQGSGAQAKLAAEALRAQIYGMLSQNHYLNLSVALSMTPGVAAYTALMDGLNDVLQAKTDEEVQWFALPAVLVAGCKQASALPAAAPVLELSACLANYPHTRPLANAVWLPRLLPASALSAVNAGQWFQAKQNTRAAAEFAQSLPAAETLPLPPDQSVSTVFALGYGDKGLAAALGKNLQDAGLPLMQVWHEALATKGVTLFANPLPPEPPVKALTRAGHMRLRMALEVFAANAIRAIRLQSPRVGVVMAAQEGGRLLFGFNAAESQYELQPQVFAWPLSPMDNIEIIQQDFLDLMAECRVENIRLLHEPLAEGRELPDYAAALSSDGHNPLFGEGGNA